MGKEQKIIVSCSLSKIDKENDMSNIDYFNNNEGIGGFEEGGYDRYAPHPVDANWTRLSRFSIPKKPKLNWKISVDNAFIDETNIKPAFVVDRDKNIIISDCDNNLIGKHYGRLYKITQAGESSEILKIDKRLKSPVIGPDESVYVTTCDVGESKGQKLLCLSPDGIFKWEYSINDSVFSKPVIDTEGNVYVYTFIVSKDGSKNGTLFSINKDGILNWKREFHSINWYEPIISKNGVIYLGLNNDRKLCALNKDGQTLWERTIGQGLGLYPPVIKNDGTIYLNLSGSLFALSSDGEIIWEYKPQEGNVATSPALCRDGSLLLNLSAFRLISLDDNGKKQWETKVKGATSMPPVIDKDGAFYQQSFMQHYPQYETWIEAFSSNGDKVWTYETKGTICSTVLADDNLIYALINCHTYTKKGWLDKMIVKWELHAIGDQYTK